MSVEDIYGGSVTVQGRDLLAKLIAGETIEFTRIVVGSGFMPEGVHQMDMTDLVNPIAEATSTVPIVKDGCLFLTVEYRNDMNGGLKEPFWLSEFGIYAKTDKSPEICLYYANLGNSPQPVNAYKDNRIDIRRYPVTIELAVDADVQITYNPGAFITASEAQELIGGMFNSVIGEVASIRQEKNYVIPTEGWIKNPDPIDEDDYPYVLEIIDDEVAEDQLPYLSLDRKSELKARNAGLCLDVETLDGVLRIYSYAIPTEELTGSLTLLSQTSGGDATGGGSYVLPVASATTLGGVKIPLDSGLTIDDEGYLRVNMAGNTETDDTIDDVFGEDDGTGSGEEETTPDDGSGDTGTGEEGTGGSEEDSGTTEGDGSTEETGPTEEDVPDGYTVATNDQAMAEINKGFGTTTT